MKTLKQICIAFGLMAVLLTSMSMPVFALTAADQAAAGIAGGIAGGAAGGALGGALGSAVGAVAGQAAGQESVSVTELLPLPGNNSSQGNPYANLPQVQGATAEGRFYSLVTVIVMNARYILGAVAVAFIVYAGIRMVIGQGNEEEYTTQRRNIIYAIIGLAIVGLSGELVRIFSVYCPTSGPQAGKDLMGQACTPGGFLGDSNAILRSATLFSQRSQLVITFIKYIIGSIAVFMVVRSGFRLISSSGNEEKLTQDKKALFYGIIGLMFIILADSAINNVFYKIDLSQYPSVGGAAPGIDAQQGIKEIVGVTNLIITIISPVAIFMLLYGAFLYVTSAANEEQQTKAKRLVFAVIVGIIIIYGAFAIVSTVISGNFQGGIGTVTKTAGQ